MDVTQLDRLVRDAFAAEPEPPRTIPRWTLLEHSVVNAPALAAVAIGLATLWAVSRFTVTGELAPGQETPITVFSVVLGALGAGLIGLPLLTYVRLARVLRHGRRVVARVTELEMPDTPAGAEERRSARVRVRGQRLVEHPAGLFEEPFELEAEWAGDLIVGSEMDVVVHSRRLQVLLELGLRPPV